MAVSRLIKWDLPIALALSVIAIGTLILPARADDAALSIELNRLEQSGQACRVTFVAANSLGADIEGVSLEIVTFDGKGLVQRMTVFDFGALPNGRQRVRQFEMSETQCDSISRVLVNGVADCNVAEKEPQICSGGLKLNNKTETEFLG